MLILKTVHVFSCSSNYGNYSLSFPRADVVSGCSYAVAYFLQWSFCWSLSLISLEFQAVFSMLCLFFPSFVLLLLLSAFFSLWLPHFNCCLCLLASQNSAVCLPLSVLWKVVLCREEVCKRRREQSVYAGERTDHPAAACWLCRRMKINLCILVWPFPCAGWKSQLLIPMCFCF